MASTGTSATAQARFNNVVFNTRRFNGGRFIETLSTDLVVFDGFSLNDGSNVITSSIKDIMPTRGILGGDKPRADGRFLTADYWRQKSIVVRGYLTYSTATLLEAAMDTMRKRLRITEGNLDLTRNSVVRRYVATLANTQTLFPAREHYHTTWIPFTATFECRTPFATDRDDTTVTETITVSPTNVEAENTGTIENEPVIEIIVDAANTVTVLNVQRIDPSTGDTLDEIEYSGTVTAGDHFQFDSVNKTVKKNGTEVDYTGSFPVMDVGGNTFQFTITGTSFTLYITIEWKNRYL